MGVRRGEGAVIPLLGMKSIAAATMRPYTVMSQTESWLGKLQILQAVCWSP